MIHLAGSSEVNLDRGDVRLIEDRLAEISEISEKELSENPNRDVQRKINAVEFIIQTARE